MNESQKDAQGGAVGAPYEAYGGGMSWDPWGKKFFHNTPVEPTDNYHVAIVTPVIHYCMGGLEIDAYSRVVKKVGADTVAIDGLYAAGEIAGGVHGNNRLGGNSLLDCVVFGRVAGKHAAEYVMGTTVPTFLGDLSGANQIGGAASGGEAGGEGGGGAAVAATAQFSLDDVASHNNEKDCWVVLHDRVLDVTDFLKDHPGGVLAIITFAGKDATAEFDMIHPPDVIEKYLDPAATKGVVAGTAAAAAAAAGGGAAGGGGAAPGKVGKGKDDAKIWGKYPHETHAAANQLSTITWVTAIYLMVMAFLKEICFTIFSVPFMKVELGKKGNYVGSVAIVLLLYALFCHSMFYVSL